MRMRKHLHASLHINASKTHNAAGWTPPPTYMKENVQQRDEETVKPEDDGGFQDRFSFRDGLQCGSRNTSERETKKVMEEGSEVRGQRGAAFH